MLSSGHFAVLPLRRDDSLVVSSANIHDIYLNTQLRTKYNGINIVVNFFNFPVDFKVVQCRLSNLRKGHVALSNLRVKGPYLVRWYLRYSGARNKHVNLESITCAERLWE